MWDEYKDTTSSIDDYINHLDRYDRNIFIRGYVSCLHKLLEQISDSKFKITNKMLGSRSKKQRFELQSRLHILDVYEDHYTKVAEQMQNNLELQS